MTSVRSFDDVFEETKPYGVYQLLIFLLFQYSHVQQNGFRVSGMYMLGGLKPTYTCLDAEVEPEVDACYLMKNCRNMTVTSVYHSIYQEFEWACVDAYALASITSFIPLATLTGNLMAGHLSDWLGRKWIGYFGFIITLGSSMAASYASRWQHYVALMFLFELAAPLTYHPTFALTMETVGKRFRLMQSFCLQWSVVYMINGLIAYLIGDWRKHLQFVTITGLPILVIWLFVTESPRWLIQKKKFEKAARALNTIAWWNGKGSKMFTASDMTNVNLGPQVQHRTYNLLHLFYNRRLTMYTVSQLLNGVSINLVVFMMLMSVEELAGSPFLNVAYFGMLRLWTPFVVILLDRRASWFGRRPLFISAQGVVLGCFAALVALHVFGWWQRLHAVGTALALLGYAVDVGVVYIAYKQFTTELFPTVVRSIALACFSSASLVGNLLAPQVVYLKHYWQPMPYAAAAMLASVSLVFGALVLPETRGRVLPDTLEATDEPDDDERRRLIASDE